MALSPDDARRARQSRDALLALQTDLRDRIGDADDAQLKAVLETTAEALGGLAEAFDDAAGSDEDAWE